MTDFAQVPATTLVALSNMLRDYLNLNEAQARTLLRAVTGSMREDDLSLYRSVLLHANVFAYAKPSDERKFLSSAQWNALYLLCTTEAERFAYKEKVRMEAESKLKNVRLGELAVTIFSWLIDSVEMSFELALLFITEAIQIPTEFSRTSFSESLLFTIEGSLLESNVPVSDAQLGQALRFVLQARDIE
jgi:hypothetical protein